MRVPSPLIDIPADRHDRWRMLGELIAAWNPAPQSAGGSAQEELDAAEARLQSKLPAALREWHLHAGRRDDVWSQNDRFARADELHWKSDWLVFYVESQAIVEWAIHRDDIALADPPVYVSSIDSLNTWAKQSDTISAFAIQMFVNGLHGSNRCAWAANACVDSSICDWVRQLHPRLAIGDCHLGVATRYFGHRDLIVQIDGEPTAENFWLSAVARNQAAAANFKHAIEPLDVSWNQSTDEWPPGWVSRSEP